MVVSVYDEEIVGIHIILKIQSTGDILILSNL